MTELHENSQTVKSTSNSSPEQHLRIITILLGTLEKVCPECLNELIQKAEDSKFELSDETTEVLGIYGLNPEDQILLAILKKRAQNTVHAA